VAKRADSEHSVNGAQKADDPLDRSLTIPETDLQTDGSRDGSTDSNQTARRDGSGTETTSHSTVAFAVIFWLVLGVVVAWNTTTGRDFLVRFRLWVLIAAGLIVIALLIPSVRKNVKAATPRSREALLTFVVAPLLLSFVGTVVFMPDRYQVPVLRSIFLVIVCLLPASMWYLFIATRKTSVLNDFVSNLNRLGLLECKAVAATRETEAMFERRVYTYLQKFEAIYGRVPQEAKLNILKGKFNADASADDSSALVRSPATAPILLLTGLIALGWITTMPPWLRSSEIGVSDVPLAEQWLAALNPAETPVNFAFLGAYFFGLQMLFRRYIRRDLRGSAYVAITMRIILAVVGIWVVSALASEFEVPATDAQLLALGFVIGVFPRVAWQVVQKIFKTMTGWILQSLKTDLPVSDLDGLTVWHEARLEEEDIENIPNMATTDIVELMLNTRLPSHRIIDWVDQAVLYTELGVTGIDARAPLRAHGIRTATAFLKVSKCGQRDLGSIPVDKVVLDPESLSIALETSPQLELIRRWRGLT
jgi:hypothetical protein